MPNATAHDFDPTRAPSVFDIDVLGVARVYAEALLRAADKKGVADELQESFDALVGNPLRRVDGTTDAATLLASAMIPRGKRADVIDKLFRGRADDVFVNFLHVLNDHNRLDLLRPVAAMYRESRDELLRRVRVVVRSAVPLTDDQREQVKALAAEVYHLEPVVVEQTDPNLIGGLQVQIGDRLIDLSVRSRLQAIKRNLITRSSHEIQRRRDRVGPH
jgi:F-type H+-transporting ATPase subunit delta